MNKDLNSLKKKLFSQDGQLQGGFAVIRGGMSLRNVATNDGTCPGSNTLTCSNDGVCTGTNKLGCTNDGQCQDGTNTKTCSNVGMCYA